jgi:hypothetical protein
MKAGFIEIKLDRKLVSGGINNPKIQTKAKQRRKK